MWDILQVWGCRRVRIGGISSSNCGKRLDVKLEISIYICAHICICICICARLHIWVVRMFKNGFIAWSAWADWGNTDTWRLAILHPMLSATSIRSLCTPSLCTPNGLYVHHMVYMYTTWSLCTPYDNKDQHIPCLHLLHSVWWCKKNLVKIQNFEYWIVTHCIFGCFHNSIFHFDYFKITSSHLIHRWYKLPFFSTSSHQNQKIPVHVCVFHVSSSWILPCCCFTGIVPQPKQWSFFLMPMSEARSRFQLFCLFVCLCHFSKSRHFGAK